MGVRRRLLDSASELFRRAGRGEVSVSAIVRRAGVAKGTFFNYFPEKEDLLRALCEDALGPVGDLAVEAGFRKLRAADKLRQMAGRAVARVEGKPWLAALLARSFLSMREDGPERGLRSILAGIVREGQRGGELREAPGPEQVAEVFLGVLAAVLGGAAGSGAEGLEARVALATELLVEGLARPSLDLPGGLQ